MLNVSSPSVPNLFRTRVNQAFWVFGIAFVLRLAICVWGADRVSPTADGAFYHVVAQRIARGLGYTWLWPDGTVTFAAHYPVGYPAMMSIAYTLFGPSPFWAMLGNAFVGASGVLAAYLLSVVTLENMFSTAGIRVSAFVAAILLAASPTLIFYTPALMTELVVGALLTMAVLLAAIYQRGGVGKWTRSGLVLGLAIVLAISCLIRPQSLVMALVLGLLIGKRFAGRILMSSLLIALTVAMVSPWTLRNCRNMDSCVFVSANGGWNLLIGSYPEGHGAWIGIDGDRVPEECRTVFSETGKDKCFGAAGKKRILDDPPTWLGLIPAKLRATFDYSAAGIEHLYTAGAVPEANKRTLQALEYGWQRFFSILMLLGAWFSGSSLCAFSWRTLGLLFGIVCFMGAGAWVGWLIVLSLLIALPRARYNLPLLALAGSIASTAAIHAVFFGAGRYSLPLWYVATPAAALGVLAIINAKQRLQKRIRSS